MRGLPGGGKSTRSRQIMTEAVQNGAQGVVICSTDDFFIGEDGVYRFNAQRIAEAHINNQTTVELSMMAGVPVIIVDNTNTTHKEMEPYKRFASDYNYEVREILIGKEQLFPGMNGSPYVFNDYIDLCAGRNTHGVPRATIEKMARRFQE